MCLPPVTKTFVHLYSSIVYNRDRIVQAGRQESHIQQPRGDCSLLKPSLSTLSAMRCEFLM